MVPVERKAGETCSSGASPRSTSARMRVRRPPSSGSRWAIIRTATLPLLQTVQVTPSALCSLRKSGRTPPEAAGSVPGVPGWRRMSRSAIAAATCAGGRSTSRVKLARPVPDAEMFEGVELLRSLIQNIVVGN